MQGQLNENNRPLEHFEKLSSKRAKETLTGMCMALSLGIDQGLSIKEIVSWSLTKLHKNDYFSYWVHLFGPGNTKEFLNEFLDERKNLFDYSGISEEDGTLIVQTPLWFYKEIPETFFYLDITPEDFSEYFILMAEEKARMLGVDLSIIHHNGMETALIRPLKVDTL